MVYQGNKNRYAKYIVPILQDAIDKSGYNTFIDGCCGSCAIVGKINAPNKIAIDNNKYLIAFLDKLFKEGTDIIPETPPTREEWHIIKNNKDNYPDWYVGYVEHLCSFNGRGFIGGYTCFGSNGRDYYQERVRSLIRQIEEFKGITFLTKDINDLVCEDCVVYIDPPYNNTQKYDSLVDNPFDYEKFWDTVRRLSQNNIVFVSEEAAPEDFECIWSKTTKRTIRGAVKIVTEGLFRLKQ